MLALALLLGGSAALGIRSFLKTRGGDPSEMVNVVVPVADIPRHSVINGGSLRTRSLPRDMVPDGTVSTIEEILDRSALTTLVKGEPVLTVRLSPKGQHGLAPLIPVGMRGYTITTPNVASGVAGLLYPGNRVDVLLTVTQATFIAPNGSVIDPTGGGSTSTLLQNVELLAVDQIVEIPREPGTSPSKDKDLRSVTLLVTPEQAQKLKLGETRGTLHLSLRNPSDNADVRPRPTILTDLRFWRDRPNESNPLSMLLQTLKPAPSALASNKSRIRDVPERKPELPLPSPSATQTTKLVINTIRGGNHVGRQEMIIRNPSQPAPENALSDRSNPTLK